MIDVLLHDKARPSRGYYFESFKCLQHPVIRVDKRVVVPEKITVQSRVTFTYQATDPKEHPTDPKITIEVWCIEDYFPNGAPNTSDTKQKEGFLAQIIKWSQTPIDLVIAFGTAASRDGLACNGSVVIGRRIFINTPVPPPGHSALQSDWSPSNQGFTAGTVIDSNLPVEQFAAFNTAFSAGNRASAELGFLSAPVEPASPPMVMMSNDFISLGTVNIVDGGDYVWADAQTVNTYNEMASIDKALIGQIGSIETTHGVIRCLCNNAPFIYVSGIVNIFQMFSYKALRRDYTQNFVGHIMQGWQ
ncbi:MAG: hypothetical protein ACYDBB_05265 [Armatimonadota bacterium]